MTAYYNILETIKNQLLVDEFVNTVTQGDIFDVDLTKQTIFPLSHIMVNNVTRESNVLRFNVTVMCMDIVDKSKTETTDIFIGNDNEQDVLNTQLAVVSRMLEIFDRGGNVNTFRMDGDPNIEPFTERFENYLAGWSCTFDVLVANDMTVCGPLITPAGCAPATVTLDNTLGDELSVTSVASGASETIVAPDATYTVQYVDGTPIESGTIPSGGSVTVNVPNVITCLDANWTLNDSLGSVLDSGTIPSGGSATIVAPDATSNINKSNGSLIQSVSVPSGGIVLTNIADSVITLNNTAATTLSTTNVLATDAATIVAPDGDVNNSDSTYTASVASGGVLSLPDSQINVNSVDRGDVVSVKTIDVNVTDGVNPVTPDAVSLVGNTLTIEVPSASPAVNRSTATVPMTGQTVVYRTGDDADLKASIGRPTDFLTLDAAPLHNDGTATINTTTNRFTDTLGGSTYANDIVLDWSTWNGSTLTGWYKEDFVTIVIEIWDDAIDNALALSVGGFATWRIPNIKELVNIMSYNLSSVFNYVPFNNTSLTVVWSSTTNAAATSAALVRSGTTIISRGKGLTSYSCRCRTFSLSITNILS